MWCINAFVRRNIYQFESCHLHVKIRINLLPGSHHSFHDNLSPSSLILEKDNIYRLLRPTFSRFFFIVLYSHTFGYFKIFYD